MKNHYSFHSCLELGDDLRDMFPNNDIVSNFKLSKTKCAYLVTHGIAPWVKSNLQVEMSNSPLCYVMLLLQENYMDIQVCFLVRKVEKSCNMLLGIRVSTARYWMLWITCCEWDSAY